MTGQTVLLTGAAGFVGSALLRQLDGHPVVVLAHLKPVPAPGLHGDITRAWLGLNPADYRDLTAKVDVVVHCAASVNFGASPKTLHDLNVRGTGHVLRFVADAHARLVHVSTAYIARATTDCVPAGAEGTLGAYIESKMRGDTLVRESGLPAVIARVSTVIGDSNTGKIARLQSFHYLVGAAMRGLLPFIPSQPGTRADLIPQDTVAAALAALATTDIGRGECWITAGPASLSLERIINIGAEVALEWRRRDETVPQIYADAFKPRLVSPATYDQVMNMVLAQTVPEAKPGIITQLGGLLARYTRADVFPTTVGQIPGGPPSPTTSSVEHAVTSMCHYLAALPKETWSSY